MALPILHVPSSMGFQVKMFKTLKVVPSSLGRGPGAGPSLAKVWAACSHREEGDRERERECVCVCVYVYVCVDEWVCMYVHTRVCQCVGVYVSVCVREGRGARESGEGRETECAGVWVYMSVCVREMWGSQEWREGEMGSYLRLTDFVHRSTLGFIVKQKKRRTWGGPVLGERLGHQEGEHDRRFRVHLNNALRTLYNTFRVS